MWRGPLRSRHRTEVDKPLSLQHVSKAHRCASYVLFPAGSVRWINREPTRYRSSKDVERSFCSVCGSTVGFHRVHETSLAIGGFDLPQEVVASRDKCVHVCYQERISWFDTADNWTRFDRFGPGREDEVRSLSGQPIRG